jgi:ABC-type proline/glycine betaine transport system permease subunit
MERVIPLAEWVNAIIDFLLDIFGGFLRTASGLLMNFMDGTVDVLEWIPAPIIMIAIALVVWKWARWRYALFALASLGLMYGLGLWVRTLDTIVMVLISTLLALLVAIPLGVLAFWNDRFERILRVLLDFMQTTPAFVYLVPAVMFFGMGETSAIFATIIFAAPPPIRFINLGLREVPEELIEAGHAFGATRMQMLRKIQVPAAMPTIMGGVNQCIMLSLSMVVIASMIGAGGLGGEVLRAIQTVNVGQAFEAGLAVVLLAIIFDRTVARIRKTDVK